jgi:cytoskeletal protein CcmA (bactofilin family)
MAGGDVSTLRSHYRDLLAAGGRVRLERTQVDDDVMLAAGRIEITPGTEVGDSLVAAGREVVMEGRVGGGAEIAGNEVIIAGTIAKNLRVRADRVVLKAGARIEGDLLHSARLLEIEPGATVGGQAVPLPLGEAQVESESEGFWRRAAGILFFFGMILAPALVVAVFPQFVGSAGERLRSDISRSLGRGVLITILAPLLFGVLLASVIGAPVAIYAVFFFLAAAVLAWTTGVFAVGQQLRHGLRRRRISTTRLGERRAELFGWTLLGALALFAVLWIPVLGGVLCFLIFLSSLGAVYSQLRDAGGSKTYEQAPKSS